MHQPPFWITPQTLIDELGAASPPRVLDVRRRHAYQAAERIVAGAKWQDPEDLQRWCASLDPQRRMVLYCVHGHQVSQQATVALRRLGLPASCLRGGIEGYLEAGGPTATRTS